MLLIVTIGLVLAGVVLLIVGFVSDSLGYIYAAIVCAAIAGAALLLFTRLTRRRATRLAMVGAGGADTAFLDGRSGAEPAYARSGATREREPAAGPAPPSRARAAAPGPYDDDPTGLAAADDRRPPAGRGRQLDDDIERVPPAPSSSRGGRPGARADDPILAPAPAGIDDDFGEWDDDLVFPIEAYDDLRASDIVPLLDELEPDELDDVRDREERGEQRPAVLNRVAELLGEAAPPVAAAPRSRPPARAVDEPAPRFDARDNGRVVPLSDASPDHRDAAPARAQVRPAPSSAAARPAPAVPGAPAAPGTTPTEPIAGYATMRLGEILGRLRSLTPDELDVVEADERAGAKRAAVLNRIKQLRG